MGSISKDISVANSRPSPSGTGENEPKDNEFPLSVVAEVTPPNDSEDDSTLDDCMDEVKVDDDHNGGDDDSDQSSNDDCNNRPVARTSIQVRRASGGRPIGLSTSFDCDRKAFPLEVVFRSDSKGHGDDGEGHNRDDDEDSFDEDVRKFMMKRRGSSCYHELPEGCAVEALGQLSVSESIGSLPRSQAMRRSYNSAESMTFLFGSSSNQGLNRNFSVASLSHTLSASGSITSAPPRSASRLSVMSADDSSTEAERESPRQSSVRRSSLVRESRSVHGTNSSDTLTAVSSPSMASCGQPPRRLLQSLKIDLSDDEDDFDKEQNGTAEGSQSRLPLQAQ